MDGGGSVRSPPVRDTFFATPATRGDAEWFTPTDFARGPWDPDASHGGPPTALLVRALERVVPAMRLVRVTVDLARPVPMAGFGVTAELTKSGRTACTARAQLVDADGVVRAAATGLYLAPTEPPLFERSLDNADFRPPRLADAVPGDFPVSTPRHDLPGFRNAIEVRYPPDFAPGPGASTLWMRTIALLPGEEPSPFQRICPLADCGNAFSRHADPEQMGFLNPDLTIALHRQPVGDWLGMRATSQWQPSGIGLVTSTLFDDTGLVGTALQTVLVRPR